jgi:hypothetical protein
MKANIKVRVTYEVSIGSNMSDEVYDQLLNNDEIDGTGCDEETDDARMWLVDNIKEGDCMDIKYEICRLDVEHNSTPIKM